MALINAIIKLSELGILADGCPSRLNELGAEAPIAYPGDGALVDPVAGGILTRNQTEKGRQLSDIVNERSIADTCQQMRGRNAANAGRAAQELQGPSQVGIGFAESVNLARGLANLLLGKGGHRDQPVEFKTDRRRTSQGPQSRPGRHGPVASALGKRDIFEKQ